VTPKTQETTSVRKPVLGSIVLVPETPNHNNSSAVACAVVVGVHNDTINVRVWADNSDVPEWRTSLHQVESVEQLAEQQDGLPKMNLWCWPQD
jgi:hypothetical protein